MFYRVEINDLLLAISINVTSIKLAQVVTIKESNSKANMDEDEDVDIVGGLDNFLSKNEREM